MASRKLPLGLLLPAALVLLVGTLATLQYRWLGEVSEAEHARLQNVLRQRASDFADDFDREIVALYVALQIDAATPLDTDPSTFAAHYDAWRAAAHDPQMLRDVYVLDTSRPETSLERYSPEEKRFASASWPASLSKLRAQVAAPAVSPVPAGGAEAAAALRALSTFRDPIDASVPAVLIPMTTNESVRMPEGGGFLPMRASTHYVIAVLDRDYIATSMLPALADRYFAGSDVDNYRFAVVDNADQPHTVFSRGVADGHPLDPTHADATVGLFSLRFDLTSQVTRTLRAAAPTVFSMTSESGSVRRNAAGVAPPPPPPGPPPAHRAAGGAGGGRGAAAGPTLSFTSRGPDTPRNLTGYSIVVQTARGSSDSNVLRLSTTASAPWTLVLQHTAGSLDAAVSNARRRNLWMSFGILSVLVAGVGIVLVNAQRSERLAAQQMDFVATVSHELRTPLAVIRSAAQNLAAGVVNEPAQAKRYGDLIETEGRRLTDMVEQVLEYAGLAGGRRPRAARPTDVRAVVLDVVASCAELPEAAAVEFDVDVPADLPLIVADEEALRRAVGNLITNALKYAAAGGWIGVRAQPASPRGQREVQIAVSDHGPGIDAADAAHLFEPFYRGRRALERQIHGNGLGLSLVKRIVEAHGGRVSVSSTPNEGATFTLFLPAAPDRHGAPALF